MNSITDSGESAPTFDEKISKIECLEKAEFQIFKCRQRNQVKANMVTMDQRSSEREN